MKYLNRPLILCLACAVVTVSLLVPGVAQKKGKSRPLTTSQLMAGLVKPQLVVLQDGLKTAPKDAAAWKKLATAAALLNESGHIMMADDRCPDETWEEACRVMDEASKTTLNLIGKQDAAGALKSIGGITASCKHCHTAFKYKK